MGENWLWAVLQGQIESRLSRLSPTVVLHENGHTNLLRDIRSAIIEMSGAAMAKAVELNAAPHMDETALSTIVRLLEEYNKRRPTAWAGEALANLHDRSTVKQRTPAPEKSLNAFERMVVSIEDYIRARGDGDNMPEWLTQIRTIAETRTSIKLEANFPGTKTKAKTEHKISDLVDVANALLEGRNRPTTARALKRIVLAVSEGRLGRDFGQPEKDEDGKYAVLRSVLEDAFDQASIGKGKERHANDLPFHKQPIFTIAAVAGEGFLRGQAMKKIIESRGMTPDRAYHELLGAIVYAAAAAASIGPKDFPADIVKESDALPMLPDDPEEDPFGEEF